MKEQRIQKLIFVYNADSGVRNMVMDIAHKILSPRTYDCNLCDITFGVFTENKEWKQFRLSLEAKQQQLQFLHKDEFAKAYKSKFGYKFTFPIVLVETNNDLEILVNTQEMNGVESTQDFINLLENRLKTNV